MSRSAWLVVMISVAIFAGVLTAAQIRSHRGVVTGKHLATLASKADVDLTSVLAIQQRVDNLDLVATVTIVNKTDLPLMYVGAPCYAPASVAFQSTLRPPAGPPYPSAAAALRERVMDHRRTLDEIGDFEPSPYRIAAMEPCDESGPPLLPPKKTIRYTMTEYLGTYRYPFIDAATTDVVTTLKLGYLPQGPAGRFPPPIQTADTVEVRTPLGSVSDLSKQSAAGYEEASREFDVLMQDSRVAAWVGAQDPTLWGAARLTPDYYHSGEWSLEAFHHAWAVPLIVTGTRTAVTTVQLPAEPWKAAPSTAALLPPDSSSADKQLLPDLDMYVGDLVLPSGKVMVGDGIATDNEVLFDYGLKPGSYPVHIVTAKARYRTSEYDEVAWEELLLSDNAVVLWVPAVPVGHSSTELKPGEYFSFGTDGGSGGFASPEAMKFMDASLVNDDDPLWTALGQREEANDWLWGMTTVDPRTGANVFVTSTGGDGGFPILLGLDAHDHPAVLLSDFGVLQMTYSGMKL